MKRLRQNQSGIIYILVTIVLFLFIIGLVAFAALAIMAPIISSITPITNAYVTEAWPLYNTYQQAMLFMTNFWTYLLVLAFFGLVFWVYMYSQRRGQPY